MTSNKFHKKKSTVDPWNTLDNCIATHKRAYSYEDRMVQCLLPRRAEHNTPVLSFEDLPNKIVFNYHAWKKSYLIKQVAA